MIIDTLVLMLVEGPGHMPLDEIETNIRLQKRMSGDAPYYMLGPISSDIAPGYDPITCAIGGSLRPPALPPLPPPLPPPPPPPPTYIVSTPQ